MYPSLKGRNIIIMMEMQNFMLAITLAKISIGSIYISIYISKSVYILDQAVLESVWLEELLVGVFVPWL